MLCNDKINFETLINTVYVCMLGNISFISYKIYQNKYMRVLSSTRRRYYSFLVHRFTRIWLVTGHYMINTTGSTGRTETAYSSRVFELTSGLVGSCCSIFSSVCSVLWTIVCFVFFSVEHCIICPSIYGSVNLLQSATFELHAAIVG